MEKYNFTEYKVEVEWAPPLPPPIIFDSVDEFNFFMNPAPGIAESRIHKKFPILSASSKEGWGGGGGGGGGDSTIALYSVQ